MRRFIVQLTFTSLILCLFSSVNMCFSAEKEKQIWATSEKRQKKWETLWKMVHEELDMLQKVGNLGPKLRRRMVELKTEKMNLLKEKENQRFLRDMEKGSIKRGEKETYFKKSQSLFKEIKSEALEIIKKYPHFSDTPDIYYTLALNERDYNDSKEVERFAKKALHHKRLDARLAHNVKVVMAEHLYNEKRYPEATKFYKQVIEKSNDQWRSKHMFNLGWCQFKQQRKNKAIKILHTALKEGRKENIISIEDQIQKSLGLFYIQTKRVDEAISHFLNKKKTAPTNLQHLLKLAMSQGTYGQALKALKSLKESAKENGERETYLTALNKGLELYRGDKKYKLFIEEAKTVKEEFDKHKYKNHENKRDEAVRKISSMAGYFQELLKKDEKEENQFSKWAFTMFTLLESIDENDAHKYRFFKGETHFILKEWNLATKSYLNAYKFTRAKKLKKKMKKYLDAALGTLARAEEENSKKDEKQGFPLTRFTYYQYIKQFPKSKTAKKIYPRLFSLEFNKSHYKKAEKVITYYSKQIPEHQRKQKKLATQVLDHYIENKQAQKLNTWVKKLDAGFLGFSKKKIEKTVEILGQILFFKIEEIEKKKDNIENKKKAYQKYAKLYQKKRYPQRIKAKTSYNLFRLSIKTYQYGKAKKWLGQMQKTFTPREYKEFFQGIMALAHETFLQQKGNLSIAISKRMTKAYCERPSRRPKNFPKSIKVLNERYLTYTLTYNRSEEYLETLSLFKKCALPKKYLHQGIMKIAKKHLYEKRHQEFLRLSSRADHIKSVRHKLFVMYKKLFWHYFENDQKVVATKIKSELHSLAKGHGEHTRETKEIERYTQYLKEAKKTLKQFKLELPKSFSNKKFQEKIGRVVNKLDSFQNQTNDILSLKNSHMVVQPLMYLNQIYEKVAKELKSYNPKDVPKDIKESFHEQIQMMASQFATQSDKHMSELKKSLSEKEIYTQNNQSPYRTQSKYGKQLFSPKIYTSTYDLPQRHKTKSLSLKTEAK